MPLPGNALVPGSTATDRTAPDASETALSRWITLGQNSYRGHVVNDDSMFEVGERYGAAIDRLVDRGDTDQRVADYLDTSSQFAAYWFDEVGTNPRDKIANDDVLAVSFLDAPIRASAYRRIIASGEAISGYLTGISVDLDLWRLKEGSTDYAQAVALWCHLDAIPGMGPTRVSKLMARKRPRLIPILDERVKEFFGHETEHFWMPLAHALKDDDRRDRIEALRPEGAERLSLLRILDIAIWMSTRADNAWARAVGSQEDA